MNFWQRRNKASEKPEGFFYRGFAGDETSIYIGEGIEMEFKDDPFGITQSIVLTSKSQEKELTYEERQKEIEDMILSYTDGLYFVFDAHTSLFGKSLEDYTQKELYDALKKLKGD